jgi:solute carrier family 5 (high affinity choline transporter), member 7
MMYPLLGVCCFYLIIFMIGLQAGRKNNSQEAETVSEVLVAGRRIPLWIGVVTMTATWVDGGYLNGTAEAVYSRGIAWCQAPVGFAISLLLGGLFFARVMHENGFNTMIDPFQQRYGERLGALMYGPALLGELLWTSGILTALGTTFGVLLGLDFRIAIVVSAAMTITYTVQGGLWSIAYTDVAQLAMALCGMAICVPFVFSHFPSFGEVWALYQQKFPATSSFTPPSGLAGWSWMDSMALLICGGIPWHCYFQRILSSPTAQVARRLSIIAAVLCVLMAIPPALLGMAGAVFDWEANGLKAPEGAFLVLPQVLRDMTPTWVGIVGLCAVAGAIMSSVDASVYSAASMFSWNIMHRILRPSEDPKLVARTNKVSIVVLGIVATCIALTVKSIYLLWFLSADLVYVLLFPQLLIVLYYRRASRWGVLAGLAVGLLLRLGGGEAELGLPAFLPYPSSPELGIWFPFKTLAMLSGGITTLLVSLLPIPNGECRPVPWIQQ